MTTLYDALSYYGDNKKLLLDSGREDLYQYQTGDYALEDEEKIDEYVWEYLKPEEEQMVLGSLSDFFGETDNGYVEYDNPQANNWLIVKGESKRWDGMSAGYKVFETFAEIINFDRDGLFADCELDFITDDNGSLTITGQHHDGYVTIEVRQLTDQAQNLLTPKHGGDVAFIYDNEIDFYPDETITYNGKTYDYLTDSRPLLEDMWDDPEMCPPLNFLARINEEQGTPSLGDIAQESREAAEELGSEPQIPDRDKAQR
ncbi:hypothetical protein [Faecalicoccus pleomorphus]|uniref:hypothetical protein n=1 Tax=Faecalicoccus pleomorphus TaxID=1323 RepID=UPI0022E59D2A|nr:hypothetical protein [Faecalicoccus pleomorphus]